MQKQQVIEILEGAKVKIRQGWCKGPMARDKNGLAVWADHPSACEWCSTGAVMAVSADRAPGKYGHVLKELNRHLRLSGITDKGIISVNEDPWTKRDHILSIFDGTIQRLKTEMSMPRVE